MSRILLVEQTTTPDTPPAGTVRVYVGTAGTVQSVDDAGVVTVYAAGITQEQVEDIVGNLLQDTSSVNVTYNDAGNAITFDVLPGGVNHNLLLNYVANQHIDHSTVSISAGTGLTGGGDITTSRTISMPSVGTAGTYQAVTTDAQGRVTAGTNPTTLAGFGITDAQPLDSDLTALAAVATPGLLANTGAGTAAARTLTAGTGITVTNGAGTAGNPTVAITNVGTAGTYGSASSVAVVTTNAQGQVSAAVTTAIAILSTAVTDFAAAVRAVVLTGLSIVDSAVTAADSVLTAIGKLQGQINSILTDMSLWTELVTTGALTNSSNATLVAVSELVFTAVSGKSYYIEYTIRFQTVAAGTGIALTINTGTTAVGSISGQVNIPVAADATNNLYTGNLTTLGDLTISNAVEVANTNYIATIKALFTCTTSGTIQPYFRSEVNGSQVTFGAGSVALVREF